MSDVETRLLHILALEQNRRQVHGEPGRINLVLENKAGDQDSPQASSEYTYNAQGDLVEILEPDGRQRRYQYDRQRRLTETVHPDGSLTRFSYQDGRLAEIDDRGLLNRFRYDISSRLVQAERGAESAVYRYDETGRLSLARTAEVTDTWDYSSGSASISPACLTQTIRGVSLKIALAYDEQGRLEHLELPGLDEPVVYTWDEKGRPSAVCLGDRLLARYSFDDETKTTHLQYANGLQSELHAYRPDGRPVRFQVKQDQDTLLDQRFIYGLAGETLTDGGRKYTYDLQGRLSSAVDENGERWEYRYDELDNRVSTVHNGVSIRYTCQSGDELQTVEGGPEGTSALRFDRFGQMVWQASQHHEWSYRYDDAGRLREVRDRGERIARFLYDYKGRLVLAERPGRQERYIYGPADELLAVTDPAGLPLRLLIRTPLGVIAEIRNGSPREIVYRCDDPQGRTRLYGSASGAVLARFDYDPYGLPLAADHTEWAALTGRIWYPEIGLYWFGARWYSPTLGRFLTPDSYTGAPDDERLVNPFTPGSASALRQADARAQILNEWLKQPRVRNRYAYCANDPVGRSDPNGHWSFGGVLLTLLGAIWTLPNTLFGLLIEITCLVGEVIRWLVWLVTFGNVSWETPGFDAAASGNLNAFALVFTGGWLGSFSSLLGITFGNVFFVYKNWETHSYIQSLPDPVFPAAYNGTVSIPRSHVLYEHELRHTNQYGWLGPFFHLGMPIFGFYEWDVILHGYENAWTERDAREHAEPALGSTAPGATPGGTGGSPGGAPGGAPSGSTPPPPAPPTGFTVETHSQTRAGNIPLAGLKVQISSPAGTVDLGASNSQGGFSQSPSLTGSSFTLSAVYENAAERLRKEELTMTFSAIDPAAGTFQVAVANQILKVQQVAGAGSQDFIQNYTLDQASTSGEVQFAVAERKFTINLRLATFSLNVPYFNQNSQSDTISIIPGKDPEPSSHEVLPRYTGGILCFPSSVHMLLKYWGVEKSRAELMQRIYLEWANDGFPERADRSNTVRSATPPASPAVGSKWQDTSTLTSAGYPLKRWTGSAFEVTAESDWRVQKGAYKVWTLYAYEHKAIDAFKPADTQFNDKIDDTTELVDLPDNILTNTFKPHFRDKLAQGLPIVIGTTATAGHIMVMRGMVVDKDQNLVWMICNDPFGNLASPGSIYAPLQLTANVGLGGSNQEADVKAVQEVLKASSCYTGAINGVCDGTASDATVTGIKKFQRTKMGLASQDGLVEPGGGTDTALSSQDFSSYTNAEGENNSSSSTGDEGLRGRHVYYNENTHGVSNHLEIKGLWRGVVMLKKTTPFSAVEIAARLTPGA